MKGILRLSAAAMFAVLPVVASAQVQPTTQMTSAQIVAPLQLETARQLVNYVRLNGYTCNKPDLVRQCTFSQCFEVRCDLRFKYEITQSPTGGFSIKVN